MYNKAWIQLALVLMLMGFLLDERALLALPAFLLTILPLAWWWNRHSLDDVQYRREFSERRAFPGETVDLALITSNEKLLPLGWLLVEDQWSTALPPEKATLFPSATGQMGRFWTALSLRWYERVRRPYRICCTRRGFYPFGPAKLQSGDMLGLFQHQEERRLIDWLIVYPQVLPLEDLGFPLKEPFGEKKATWRLFEDPSRSVGIRDHQPEDGYRHIHWKATARRQDLQVKVYEPTTSHHLVVFVNVATLPKHWQGVKPLLLEKTISVAASIVSHAVEARYIVGLMANGSIPHSDQPIKVLSSRRPDQHARVLEALAAVTSFATTSIQSLLVSESPRLPWGATLVLVTSVVSQDLLAAVVRLHQVGRRLVLVSLENEPSESYDLPSGVAVYHLPAKDLPFDEALMGEPEIWTPELAPPLRFAGSRP